MGPGPDADTLRLGPVRATEAIHYDRPVGSPARGALMVPSTSGVDDEGFRAALVGAAWEMFARRSPSSVSVRVLAAMAGCSHGTITSTFGSRSGLERAVADQVAVTVEEAVVDVLAQPGWPFGAMLRMRHEHPRVTRLFVRLGLGDLPIDDFLSRSTIGDRLVGRIEGFRGGSPRRPTQRSRLAAHGVEGDVDPVPEGRLLHGGREAALAIVDHHVGSQRADEGDLLRRQVAAQPFQEGVEAREAILRTCRERARPVVLTAVTAILGVLPIALNIQR